MPRTCTALGFATGLFVSSLAPAAFAEAFAPPEGAEAIATFCTVLGIRGQTDPIMLPANAPAIPLRDTSQNATAKVTVAARDSVTFTTERDARENGILLVRPSAELPVGSTSIDWTLGCTTGVASFGVAQLAVTPTAPLPTIVGAVTDGASMAVTFDDAVTPWLDVASVEAHLVSNANVVFLAGGYGLQRGKRGVFVAYRATAAGSAPAGFGDGSRPILEATIDGACRDKRGRVEVPVSVSLHIAGAASDPAPVVGNIAVDCDEAQRQLDIVSSARAGEGGCSASRGPTELGGASLFGLVCAAGLFVRRISKRR